MNIPYILDSITELSEFKQEELLGFHSLSGLVFHRYDQYFPKIKNKLKRDYIRNWKKNIEICNVLDELSRVPLKGDLPILLKGATLIEDIYPELGSRPMCDIDFLIRPEQHQCCSEWLLNLGFSQVEIKTWKGDDFKSIFKKKCNGEDIIIEVHTRLFWHTNFDVCHNLQQSKYSGFLKLSLEENIVYLVGHLGFQHTLSKLSWFFDLYYLIDQNKERIDWKRVKKISSQMKLKRSLNLISWILNKYFFSKQLIPIDYRPSMRVQRIITTEFLWKDVRPKMGYYLIKHLLKDSFIDALKYDFLWAMSKVKKMF
jgi:hypothetical protein